MSMHWFVQRKLINLYHFWERCLCYSYFQVSGVKENGFTWMKYGKYTIVVWSHFLNNINRWPYIWWIWFNINLNACHTRHADNVCGIQKCINNSTKSTKYRPKLSECDNTAIDKAIIDLYVTFRGFGPSQQRTITFTPGLNSVQWRGVRHRQSFRSVTISTVSYRNISAFPMDSIWSNPTIVWPYIHNGNTLPDGTSH